jgi:hypothetical protein
MRIGQFLVALLWLSAQLYAQSAAGILDSTRRIDWSAVGIPGGIPTRPVCTTVSASTYGNGTSDATSGIQNALNNCPANQAVALSAGTFRINGAISIPSNRTLKGAGANDTILDVRGSSAPINLGSSDMSGGGTAITSGATAGSRSIVVASASGISVGSLLHITELNDPSFVTIAGEYGSCSWCDGWWNGNRARGQIVEVTSVNGTTIGISPALYSDYSHSPQFVAFTPAAKYAGVEDLQLYMNKTGTGQNIRMSRCAYCWVKGIHSNFADGDHIDVYWSYRGEIRDSYFHDGYSHTSGNTDDDVMLAFKTSGMLVENNILIRLHGSIMLNWGAAGNVVAYNYMDQNYDTTYPNTTMMNLAVHGAHPQFNLWEGNVATSIHPDSMWGSSSHTTAFRNWATGITQICLPYSTRGTPGACHNSSQAIFAFAVDYLSAYYSLVGNIGGSAALHAATTEVAQLVSPSSRSGSGRGYDYTFGYGIDSTGSATPAYTTAFLHGNYANADGSTNWASGTTQSLPASFYLSSKPSWWGSGPWPAIGPDVNGGPGPGGHAYQIPAQLCYENTPKDANGYLVFDPDSCYGQSSSPSVAAPTDLTVVVH